MYFSSNFFCAYIFVYKLSGCTKEYNFYSYTSTWIQRLYSYCHKNCICLHPKLCLRRLAIQYKTMRNLIVLLLFLDLFLMCYVISDCNTCLVSISIAISGTRCKPPIKNPCEIATEFSPLNLSCADFPKQMILYDKDQI